MAALEERIRNAVTQHKGYVLENLSTLTMKKFREMLEEDMELPPKTLRDYRALVDGLVDEIVVEHTRAKIKKVKAQPEEAEADHQTSAEKRILKPHNRNKKEAAKKEAKSTKKEKSVKKEHSSGEKRRRNDDAPEKAKKRQKGGEKKAAPAKTGTSYSKTILKLKDVCKKAAINIPTAIYKKNKTDGEIADALSDLLDRHGLTKDSGRSEIAAARAKIQKEKDLEGGRRASRATVNYSQANKGPDLGMTDSEEEEEETPEPENDDESDENGGSDEEMEEDEPKPQAKAKGKEATRKVIEDEEEGEDEDSEKQLEEEMTDSLSDAGAASDGNQDLQDKQANAKAVVRKATPVRTPGSGVRITARRSEGSSQNKSNPPPTASEEEESEEPDDEEEFTKPRRKIADWSDSE